jgi:hypothetical protein
MRSRSIVLLSCAFLMMGTSCSKGIKGTSSADTIVVTGTLEPIGMTTFMYGTHRLVVSPSIFYVLESTTMDLNPFVGERVQITATDTHYQAEAGPDMYNVTAISAL